MTKVLVLGSTGMLGSQVAKIISEELIVTEANRIGKPIIRDNLSIKLDATDVDSVKKVFSTNYEFDYVINCIGTIKQVISQTAQSAQNAIRINSQLPFLLEELSLVHNFKVIQICTDCVFSGKTGGSSENTPHDPEDIYGKTKSLGEVTSQSTMNIRCSIVGREISSTNSLLEWFLRRPVNSKVSGFTNHFWNGVTTLHFSHVIKGIILNRAFTAGTFHLIPSDHVSKYDLLKLFADEYERKDIEIDPIEMQVKVERTLRTIYPEMNTKMWVNAGYVAAPTIKSMISALRIQNDMENVYG